MNKRSMRGFGMAVVALAASALAYVRADGADTTYASTSMWYVVTASDLSTPVAGATLGVGGAGKEYAGIWTAIPADAKRGCSATAKDGKLNLATSYNVPLNFAPVETIEKFSFITNQFELTFCDAPPATHGALAAICTAPDDNDVLRWHVWDGGAWAASGTALAWDDTNRFFEVVLETDADQHRFRYLGRKLPDAEQSGGEPFEICGWTSSPNLTNPITNLSFYGETTLGDFSAECVRWFSSPSVRENIMYVVIMDMPGSSLLVEKDSEWFTTYGVPKGITEPNEMNTTVGENGLTYLQSYVLGLDPTSPTSRPCLMIDQNESSSELSFNLRGIAIHVSSGANVTYCVNTYAGPDDDEPVATSAFVATDEAITLSLPTESDPVRYYRVEIHIR